MPRARYSVSMQRARTEAGEGAADLLEVWQQVRAAAEDLAKGRGGVAAGKRQNALIEESVQTLWQPLRVVGQRRCQPDERGEELRLRKAWRRVSTLERSKGEEGVLDFGEPIDASIGAELVPRRKRQALDVHRCSINDRSIRSRCAVD